MAGTKAGGVAAAKTNKAKYGADFYSKIGVEGGKKGRTGGFYGDPERARIAGALGGRKSKRRPATAYTTGNAVYVTTKVKTAPLPKPKFYQLKYRRNLKRLGIK